MTTSAVSFPGLGLEFHLNRVAFTLFGINIYWYGLIIAVGFLLAVMFCCRKAPKLGVAPDDLITMLLFAVPLAIIGARLYYVIFYLDLYRRPDGSLDFLEMLFIRDGGLAIYGGIIAAVLTVIVFCRVKRIKVSAMLDVGAFGLLIGQAVGRWGNFFNVEAYGADTTLPWRMGIWTWSAELGEVYHEVHPTFLYESLWNLVGLALLLIVCKRWRKFDGQIFLTYVAWYGLGRAWIEGLRTDSLYLFQTGIRVSQLLAAVTAVVALGLLAYHLIFRRHTPEELWVNRPAATQTAGEPSPETDAAVENAPKDPADDQEE